MPGKTADDAIVGQTLHSGDFPGAMRCGQIQVGFELPLGLRLIINNPMSVRGELVREGAKDLEQFQFLSSSLTEAMI